MRTTRALIVAAAIGAAGIASSQAQVYSQNVVGYVNLTLLPGFNLVGNQLTGSPDNAINTILPSMPNGVRVLTWINGNYSAPQAYYTADQSPDGGVGWYDDDAGTPSTITMPPGTGFFFDNNTGGPLTVTLVGEVPQGSIAQQYPAGLNMTATTIPSALPLDGSSSFPVANGMQLLNFNASTGNYEDVLAYYTADQSPDGGVGWYNDNSGEPVTTPAPGVGTGYFVNNLSGTQQNWSYTFNVQ